MKQIHYCTRAGLRSDGSTYCGCGFVYLCSNCGYGYSLHFLRLEHRGTGSRYKCLFSPGRYRDWTNVNLEVRARD